MQPKNVQKWLLLKNLEQFLKRWPLFATFDQFWPILDYAILGKVRLVMDIVIDIFRLFYT
jgi:hypothetical protein